MKRFKSVYKTDDGGEWWWCPPGIGERIGKIFQIWSKVWMPRRMWRLIANPLGRLAPRREIAFSLVLGTDDFGALPRINWNRWIQTGKFCNIGDTRSRTDFQFPRCRTIKLQSANTISTAAPRENEYSKVASLKSKCQSALRRRRTEEGGLVVGGGEREREEGRGRERETKWKRFLIRLRHRCHFTMTTNTDIWPFSKSASKCAIDVYLTSGSWELFIV